MELFDAVIKNYQIRGFHELTEKMDKWLKTLPDDQLTLLYTMILREVLLRVDDTTPIRKTNKKVNVYG